MADETRRVILLNWLVSRSVTKARDATPPTHSAHELVDVLRGRFMNHFTIEFLGVAASKLKDETDEVQRIASNRGKSCIRLSDIRILETESFKYVTMLFKYINAAAKGFSVENIIDFEGREVEGTDQERGVIAAHVSIRLPLNESQLDLGSYRCTLDAASPLTRSAIENFLCRQLRRHADWEFSVVSQGGRRKRPITKTLKYTPRLELHTDVGQQMTAGVPAGGELSSMVFTKRSERQTLAPAAEVRHEDILANIEIKISARQAPVDPVERANWIEWIRQHYTSAGFESKLYYRHLNGEVVGGEVHHAVEGAADIFICPKEYLDVSVPFKSYKSQVNEEIAQGMKNILDEDRLWMRSN